VLVNRASHRVLESLLQRESSPEQRMAIYWPESDTGIADDEMP
jgi:hypothetical protein